MFERFRKERIEDIDELIQAVTARMDEEGPDAEDYEKHLGYLEQLNSLKTERSKPISRDTILVVFSNLAGIGLIIAYEQKHVWTSKAFGFGMNLRKQ